MLTKRLGARTRCKSLKLLGQAIQAPVAQDRGKRFIASPVVSGCPGAPSVSVKEHLRFSIPPKAAQTALFLGPVAWIIDKEPLFAGLIAPPNPVGLWVHVLPPLRRRCGGAVWYVVWAGSSTRIAFPPVFALRGFVCCPGVWLVAVVPFCFVWSAIPRIEGVWVFGWISTANQIGYRTDVCVPYRTRSAGAVWCLVTPVSSSCASIRPVVAHRCLSFCPGAWLVCGAPRGGGWLSPPN